MCVPHAQISYFPSPYVMDRMQNGGFGSVAFDRAFMSCVEETSSQRYRVEFKQVMKSHGAGHQLKDKLAKIRPLVTEKEVDLIGEEETTVMTIPARDDALLVFKEAIKLKKAWNDVLLVFKEAIKSKKTQNDVLLVFKEAIKLKKEGRLLFYSASTESVNQDEATRKEIWTRVMRTDQIKMTVAKDVPEHQMTTNQPCYKSAKNVENQIKEIHENAMLLPGGEAVKLQGQNNRAPAGVARPYHRCSEAMGRKEAVRLKLRPLGFLIGRLRPERSYVSRARITKYNGRMKGKASSYWCIRKSISLTDFVSACCSLMASLRSEASESWTPPGRIEALPPFLAIALAVDSAALCFASSSCCSFTASLKSLASLKR
jgi:hypothetical protein